MKQEIGNSHVWIPIEQENARNNVLPPSDSEFAINLHDEYPLPPSETLQSVWDNRIEYDAESPSGVVTPSTVFNNDAEGETVFWYMGYGSSVRSDGGAREAVAMAALNPDKKFVAVDEIQQTPKDVQMASALKNMTPYANAYMSHMAAMEKLGIVPDILAGRSKGGRVATIMASHQDMASVDRIITADMPGARVFPSKFYFGALTGFVENLDHFKGPTLEGINKEEEVALAGLSLPISESMPMKEILKEGSRDAWLIRSLGSLGLHKEVMQALEKQPKARFTNYHAVGNLAMPLRANNQLMADAMAAHPDRVDAYIGYTRHFAEGHTPRFARQVAHSTGDSLKA